MGGVKSLLDEGHLDDLLDEFGLERDEYDTDEEAREAVEEARELRDTEGLRWHVAERLHALTKPRPVDTLGTLYHYTPLPRLPLIIGSGELLPNLDGVWFSVNPWYEIGADIMQWVEQDGRYRRAMSLAGVCAHGGAARVRMEAYDIDGLMDYPTSCIRDRFSAEYMEGMVAWAQKHGTSLGNWYCTTLAVPLIGARFDIFDGEVWRECSPQSVQRMADWRALLLDEWAGDWHATVPKDGGPTL